MHDAIVIEYDTTRPDPQRVRIHVVSLPDVRDAGHYRDIRSWSAFGNIMFPARRRFSSGHYRAMCMADYEMSESFWKRTCKRNKLPYHAVPEVRHASLQSFYDHIGYNRKTKRVVEKRKR